MNGLLQPIGDALSSPSPPGRGVGVRAAVSERTIRKFRMVQAEGPREVRTPKDNHA